MPKLPQLHQKTLLKYGTSTSLLPQTTDPWSRTTVHLAGSAVVGTDLLAVVVPLVAANVLLERVADQDVTAGALSLVSESDSVSS